MERYKILRKILEERQCFKLVCGAGNEDPEEVRRLSVVFTLAGATMLDLSANLNVIDAARNGVNKAYELAPLFEKKIAIRPYLNVSIGLKGDPHVRKAKIDAHLCVKCGKCVDACAQGAIRVDFVVVEYKCIGCGHCAEECSYGAVQYIHKMVDIGRILPGCVKRGIETMELHAVTQDNEAVFSDWKLLNSIIKNNFLSMCLDRALLSDKDLIERIRKAYDITGERLIIQADGVPMSGEEDDYNTTLQAVACADIVLKSSIPVMILLSGGTNSKTGLLARQCGVKANGVAVGSFARKIMKKFIKNDDFDRNISLVREAVTVAEKLIRSNLEVING